MGVSPCLAAPVALSAARGGRLMRLDVAAQVDLKAKFESVSSYFSFKRSVLGTFNVGSIGSTCTALP
jgi:hypothetical protein